MTAETLLGIGMLALSASIFILLTITYQLRKEIHNLYHIWRELGDELDWTRISLNKVEILVKALASKKGNK